MRGQAWWSRLGSNQRPSACEADALPLSHGTERATPRGGAAEGTLTRQGISLENTPSNSGFVSLAKVGYCHASQRATTSPEACGCSAVGSASPCQGEGRGFESRHPLEGATGIRPQRWSGRVVRQRPAKPCTRVRFPSPPPSSNPARLAQRESASLTRKRSLVQSQYRAQRFSSSEGIFLPPHSCPICARLGLVRVDDVDPF